MDYKWLAVPVVLIIALGAALYLNQPKVTPVGDLDYIDVNGDEYLPGDYVTDDQIETGATEDLNITSDYDFPETPQDCVGKSEADRDQCLLIYSVMNEDGSGCRYMQNPDSKNDCFYRAAYYNANAGMCENVGIGRQQCYVDVAIQKQDPSLCEKGHMNEDICHQAFAAKNMDLCAESDDKRHCNDAVFFNDESYCDLLESDDAYCYYTIAADTNNSALCANAGPSSSTCYFKIALELNDVRICENLTESRDNCVAWIAYNTGNRNLCYQAGAEQQSCLDDIDSGQ